MKEALIGVVIGILIVALLSPCFSLLWVRDIADELEDIKYILEKAKKGTKSRLERAVEGRSAEVQYDFLNWLLNDYGRQFTDSRQAVIDWLKDK